MTALPPTRGHLRLLQFLSRLSSGSTAIVCTQPSEPFSRERFEAIASAAPAGVQVVWLHREIEQNPEAPGFWDMWVKIMREHGFEDGDIFTSSEPYGKTMAEKVNGTFFPYDIDREILWAKGTRCRDNPYAYFSDILPEFQKHLRQTVTFIGAESTGKTTLSRHLAKSINAWWLMEWARPYLEGLDDKTITVPVMENIHVGQRALEDHSEMYFEDRPWIFRDTDLYATVGYWGFWRPGECPPSLLHDARHRKADLYIIPRSIIPFEHDSIRYGGDVRESDDQYWIDLMEREGLNYVVLETEGLENRADEVTSILVKHWAEKVIKPLAFDRMFSGVGTRYV